MRGARLLAGYVIRVAVHEHRWRIVLVDLKGHATLTFDDFESLAAHLELDAAQRALSRPQELE